MRALARVLRWCTLVVLWALVVVVSAVLIALLWARSERGRSRLRELVLTRVQATVPGLDVRRIGGDLTRSVVLEDVVVRDADGDEGLAARAVSARFNLLALLRRRLEIDELVIAEPRVHTRNLAGLTRPSGKPSRGLPWDVDLRGLRVEHGAIDLGGTRALAVDAALSGQLRTN